MTRQEYANIELQEFQQSCSGLTERRLRDFINALDDLRSLASRRQGAQILRASTAELKKALRSLHDLYVDLGELEPPSNLVIRMEELRELRRVTGR